MRILHTLLIAVLPMAIGACAVDTGPMLLPGKVDAPPPPIEASAADATFTDMVWRWMGTQMRDGSNVRPDSDRYDLEFLAGGAVNVRADCNTGRGSYVLDGSKLSLGPVALTKMMCAQDSKDREFLRELASVTNQSVEGRNLVLEIPAGTMRFTGVAR
jgi:heat shock protein HslJ